MLAAPAGLKDKVGVPITPWRIAAKVKADPSAARLEQLETSYGFEDRALKFAGAGDIRFGASPLLRVALSARQLDADKFVAKDNNAAEPIRLLPGLRALMAAIPQAADSDASRIQLRADHAGRTPVAEFCRRTACRRQLLASSTGWNFAHPARPG